MASLVLHFTSLCLLKVILLLTRAFFSLFHIINVLSTFKLPSICHDPSKQPYGLIITFGSN